MEATLDRVLNIDKSNWELVRFGGVVEEPKETSNDFEAEGIEHIVGLEHIDSEDIHLRRSATTEESTTFTKRFRPGDVLFGRRRAYLKKAALAEFDGVCSGDITVFRAKPSLMPELLPFIVNNDKFFDYAVKHSAGGLSPRVKFRDLANYEFLLPPKEQQPQLAELLWAMDEVVEQNLRLKDSLEAQFEAAIEYRIHGVNLKGKTINQGLSELEKRVPLTGLENRGILLKGKGIPKAEVKDEGIPCVRYGELYTHHHRIIREFNSHIDRESATQSLKLRKNDVVFAGSGETIVEIGKSAAFVDDIEAYVGSDTLVFRPTEMDGTYLGYLMNSQIVRQQLNKYGTGATVMHIYNSDLEKLKIPSISLAEQVEIGEELEQIAITVRKLNQKIDCSKQLLKSSTNQIF